MKIYISTFSSKNIVCSQYEIRKKIIYNRYDQALKVGPLSNEITWLLNTLKYIH